MPSANKGMSLQAQAIGSQTFKSIIQPATSPIPTHPPRTKPEASQYYIAGVLRIAAFSRHSVTDDNRTKRDRIITTVTDFLQTQSCGLGIDLHNCGPVDVLLFISEHYIPQHGRSRLPNGQISMSPGSVANVISHISMGLKELGRGNAWINNYGNPALAPEVAAWQQAFRRQSTAGGFQTTGAQVSLHKCRLLCVGKTCMQPIAR